MYRHFNVFKKFWMLVLWMSTFFVPFSIFQILCRSHVFFFYCWCNIFLQRQWPKTTYICYVSVISESDVGHYGLKLLGCAPFWRIKGRIYFPVFSSFQRPPLKTWHVPPSSTFKVSKVAEAYSSPLVTSLGVIILLTTACITPVSKKICI